MHQKQNYSNYNMYLTGMSQALCNITCYCVKKAIGNDLQLAASEECSLLLRCQVVAAEETAQWLVCAQFYYCHLHTT